MEQWNVEAFRDRAKKFTEDARALSNDFQYAIGLREKQKEGEDMKKKICTVLAIIGGIIAFCGLAYGVYRLLALSERKEAVASFFYTELGGG